jgi:hypothetical protein
MSKKKEPEYTTPDEYRLAHKKWARAHKDHAEALIIKDSAEQELKFAALALVDANAAMQDASAGLARYTVDEVG